MRGRGRSMETHDFQDEIWTPKKEGTDVRTQYKYDKRNSKNSFGCGKERES